MINDEIIELEVIGEESEVEVEIDFKGEVIHPDPEALESAYEEGVSDGYATGYYSGYEDGYEIGHDGGREAGYSHGYVDGENYGKQAEHDKFWGIHQDNGNRTQYPDKCFTYGWTDENFKPKYDIKGTVSATAFQFTKITDLRPETLGVAIDFSNAVQFNYMLDGAAVKYIGVVDMSNAVYGWCLFGRSKVEYCEKLILPLTDKADLAFRYVGLNIATLKDITFEGTLYRDVSFQSASKLSAESAKSAMLALADYAGTDNEFVYSITFHGDVWKVLDAEGDTAPHGGTWRNYIEAKGWNS